MARNSTHNDRSKGKNCVCNSLLRTHYRKRSYPWTVFRSSFNRLFEVQYHQTDLPSILHRGRGIIENFQTVSKHSQEKVLGTFLVKGNLSFKLLPKPKYMYGNQKYTCQIADNLCTKSLVKSLVEPG